MGRFRHYKDYSNDSATDNVDEWENSYNGLRANRIANKTIIRTFVNYFKYGSNSKDIFVWVI